MASNHELQERYSSMVLAKLRFENVLKDGVIFNNNYEGNPTAGAVKVPVRDTEVIASDYDRVAGLNPKAGATTYLTISINRDKAVNEIIDGYEAAAVPDGIVAERLDSAAYSLARALDTDGGSELLTGSTAVTLTAALSKSNIYSAVVDARTALSTANVPFNGRFLLATPATMALLLKSDEFIHASSLGDQTLQSGVIGRIAGFNVIEWNDSTAKLAFVVGHPDFCTRVREWQTPIKLQDLSQSGKWIGASAVQGRMVFAHKITRKAAVIKYSNPA